MKIRFLHSRRPVVFATLTSLLLFLFLPFSFVSAQQARSIKGKVTDSKGEPLIGVNVVVKGTSVGTITNVDGNYVINNAPEKGTIVFTYIGYVTQSKSIAGTTLNIVLAENQKSLDEVVVVGYGTQKKLTVTGAIGTVRGEQMLKAPVAAIGNSLVGRTPGLVSVQRSGEPGKDVADIYIRGVGTFGGGTGPLVVVDGVERKFNEIDPNEVESVNILKDASATAVYGIRGANGVIIVTTKVGQEGKAQVSYTMNYGLQNPIRLPKLLDSYQYALLHNEASVNSNAQKLFSDFDLERFQKKDDPYFHPDINWLDYMLKEYAPQQQHNVNISGGTKNARYFVSLGLFNQSGAFKMADQFKDFSANPEYNRYNLRTNIDVDWTKDFTTSLKVGTSMVSSNYAGGSSDSFLGTVYSANPMMSPVVVDGKVIRNVQGSPSSQVSNTPLYQLLSYGFNKNFSSNLNIDLSLKYNLQSILKGLSVRGKFAYDSYYNQSVSRNKQIPMYDLYRKSTDVNDWNNYITPVLVHNTYEGPVTFASEGYSKNNALYTEAALEYSNTFNGNTLSALFLGNTRRFYDGASGLPGGLPYNVMGFVGRVTYNYQSKYIAEVNMGYNGSEQFIKGKQFGLFPAVSLGYVLSQESFFPKTEFLPFVKLRASYGLVGNDKNSFSQRFFFLPDAFTNVTNNYYDARYYFGDNLTAPVSLGYKESLLGNPDVTWEKAQKYNYGLDLKFFGEKLSISGDYFNEIRNDILWSPNIPLTFGNAALVAPYNIGKTTNHGFEIEVGYKAKIDKFSYWVNGNYSFARNKIIYKDETPKKFPGLVETGYSIGQPKGLQADGLYNTQEEIDNPNRPKSIWEGAGLKPGDIRYVDQNGDKIIDDNDRINIGYPNIPEIVYGLSFGFEWRGFEVSALFQGTENVSTYIVGDGSLPFIGGQKAAFESNLERWTPERYAAGEKITFPRVTLSPSSDQHNYRYSSYWQQDASYLRLKNMEIAYKFQFEALRKVGIRSFRVFTNGQNLLTWTKMPYYDPEMAANRNGAVYPMARVFNVGFNLQF